MYNQVASEEELCGIRQFLLEDMATQYEPSIRIMKLGRVPEDSIAERVRKRLERDLEWCSYRERQFREIDSRIYEESGVSVNSFDIYLQLKRDYLLLLEIGGLNSFLKALE